VDFRYQEQTMKTIPVFLLSMSLPLVAGTSAKETVAPAPSEPCAYNWFTGASIGYLTELEEPMYDFHLGLTNTCWNLGGWNVALFAEIGYTEKDDDWSGRDREVSTLPRISEGDLDDLSGNIDDLEGLLSDIADNTPWDTGCDLDIMPITLNVKLERPITGDLNVYFGGGLGMALVDLSVEVGEFDFSDDDWVFTGQLFAGLNYNFNPNFEVYGGARWIYYDDASMSDNDVGGDLELDDDFLIEIGARINF
jgi:opacity protein-like surface antigen